AGIRIALNNNLSLSDIDNLIMDIYSLFPAVLKEEGESMNDISNYFGKNFPDPFFNYKQLNESFSTHHFNSIKDIERSLWNKLLGSNGSFDYDGCLFLESSFSGNDSLENNWKFHYFILYDNESNPVIATFFTELLVKDDMLASSDASKVLEEKRKTNKYYLSSKVMMMGSLLTEGEHIYINKRDKSWKKAFRQLLFRINNEKRACNASGVYLRDFDTNDDEIRTMLIEEGFVKVDMPDSHILNNVTDWDYRKLKKKKRKHVEKYCVEKEDMFVFEEVKTIEEIDKIYELYKNVKQNSLKLNTFDLPKKLFKNFIINDKWEAMGLRLQSNNQLVAIVFNFKGEKNYCPMVIGLDYNKLKDLGTYRQTIYRTILRAKLFGYYSIHFGMEAPLEKRKFGVDSYKKSAYIQYDDTFNMDIIGHLSVNN
ncbi:MAG: GNAT family N-acetyltransferase, partial [Cyclobacteriaceae bacterium]|nr:GNAT family N-acetyltransferase [Cyclobacteriaceae bacterium]